MRKLFLSITFVIAALALYSQGPASAILNATAGTDTCFGVVAKSIILPDLLPQEYDFSYQIIPTQVSGDSLNTVVTLWQSNTYAGTAWTEITSARDTITAATGILIEGTDTKALKHKLILTGISTDTSKVIVYSVFKLPKESVQ